MASTEQLMSILYVLEHHPEQLEVQNIRGLVVDHARQNAKRPAQVTLAIADDVVKGLRGPASAADVVLLLRIPKAVIEQSERRIIRPGEELIRRA